MLMVMTTMAVLCNDFLLTCPLASVVDFHESCVYLSLCLTLSCSVDFHLLICENRNNEISFGTVL